LASISRLRAILRAVAKQPAKNAENEGA